MNDDEFLTLCGKQFAPGFLKKIIRNIYSIPLRRFRARQLTLHGNIRDRFFLSAEHALHPEVTMPLTDALIRANPGALCLIAHPDRGITFPGREHREAAETLLHGKPSRGMRAPEGDISLDPVYSEEDSMSRIDAFNAALEYFDEKRTMSYWGSMRGADLLGGIERIFRASPYPVVAVCEDADRFVTENAANAWLAGKDPAQKEHHLAVFLVGGSEEPFFTAARSLRASIEIPSFDGPMAEAFIDYAYDAYRLPWTAAELAIEKRLLLEYQSFTSITQYIREQRTGGSTCGTTV